ncbi:MAG TPA: immunoglobulin domain-containing protein [Verrucomicrobiae bacterium]|nr:immunoglobulin domain-containing protein [Verrucomicrobiae bacterium]
MKNRILPLLTFVCCAHAAQAQFNPGNLAVLRVGSAAEILTNAGNAIFIDQYTTAGTWINTVAIPTNGADSLLISGKASSEGALNLSWDKHLLTIAGYSASLGFAGSLPDTTSTAVPRAVATVDYLGNYNFVTGTTAYFSANNVRSGVTDGTNNFWAAGATDGTVYLGVAVSPNVVQSVNTEVVSIFNGNLCFSSQKISPIGIWGFNGTPVSTTGPSLIVACSGPTSPSPYAFAISPDGSTVYVADDDSIAKGGGVQKYVNGAGTWGLAYTLGTGAGSTTGARGLTVDFSGAEAVLYATTADSVSNRLIRIVDGGSGSAAGVIATAGTGELFRGVQFVPQGYVPTITGQPQNETEPLGQAAGFSVAVSGTAPFGYQWEFDSSAMAGETNSSLTIGAVSTNDAGSYQVVITNAWGATTSLVAVLAVGSGIPLPEILSGPVSQTNDATTTASFSATVSGMVSLYQWEKNGTNIAGATHATLTIADVLGANAGSYQIVLSNSSGTVTSAPALLTVIDPYIVTQPGGQTYLAGATALLSAGAVGTLPLRYQWNLNGVPLAGATSTSLTRTNLQSIEAGSYSVLVTNAAGSATSSNAPVLVALAQTTFFPSNLAVLRIGDGAQTLTSSGNTLFVDQFTTNGAYVSTMNIPDSGTNALLISGVSSSEGYMTLSAGGKSLVIAGYNTNRGSIAGTLSSTTSAAVPRAIATVSGNGVYSLAVDSSAEYTTNHFRSAFTDDTGNFWGAGSYYGIWYFGAHGTAANLQDALGNCRVVSMVAGDYLAFSTQTETPGVYVFGSPTPTSATGISLVIGTGSESSPEDFVFGPGNLFAYVADDSAAGGIQRWQPSGDNWVLAYTLSSGVTSVGVRSFAVDFSQRFPVLYAVTAETVSNRLITITDSGINSVASTWATAPANQLFRAIKRVPAVQPIAAILSTSPGATPAINVSGTPGYQYVIESSSNLTDWVAVGTNPVPFLFNAGATSNSPARFYRAVSGQ